MGKHAMPQRRDFTLIESLVLGLLLTVLAAGVLPRLVAATVAARVGGCAAATAPWDVPEDSCSVRTGSLMPPGWVARGGDASSRPERLTPLGSRREGVGYGATDVVAARKRATRGDGSAVRPWWRWRF